MANKIKFKRGLKSKLPTLEAGEPAFLTDTRELFVGTGSGNVNISGSRAATYIVAASNSVHKETADYICDGTADQVEINAAINALPAAGGKVLLLEGTYNITATITIYKNNVVLEGMGMYNTKITGTFEKYCMFDGRNYEGRGLVIRNVCLSSNNTNGCLVNPSSNGCIENVYFVHGNIPGVLIESVDDLHISGCVFDGEVSGVEISSDAGHIVITNNTFSTAIAREEDVGVIQSILLAANLFTNSQCGLTNTDSGGCKIVVSGNLEF